MQSRGVLSDGHVRLPRVYLYSMRGDVVAVLAVPAVHDYFGSLIDTVDECKELANVIWWQLRRCMHGALLLDCIVVDLLVYEHGCPPQAAHWFGDDFVQSCNDFVGRQCLFADGPLERGV